MKPRVIIPGKQMQKHRRSETKKTRTGRRSFHRGTEEGSRECMERKKVSALRRGSSSGKPSLRLSPLNKIGHFLTPTKKTNASPDRPWSVYRCIHVYVYGGLCGHIRVCVAANSGREGECGWCLEYSSKSLDRKREEELNEEQENNTLGPH